MLAASAYPFEIADAQQWVQDHPKWKHSKLMKEAKKQNWDPKIQGLVAFQALTRLYQGVNWTTPPDSKRLPQTLRMILLSQISSGGSTGIAGNRTAACRCHASTSRLPNGRFSRQSK